MPTKIEYETVPAAPEHQIIVRKKECTAVDHAVVWAIANMGDQGEFESSYYAGSTSEFLAKLGRINGNAALPGWPSTPLKFIELIKPLGSYLADERRDVHGDENSVEVDITQHGVYPYPEDPGPGKLPK